MSKLTDEQLAKFRGGLGPRREAVVAALLGHADALAAEVERLRAANDGLAEMMWRCRIDLLAWSAAAREVGSHYVADRTESFADGLARALAAHAAAYLAPGEGEADDDAHPVE